MNEDEIKNGPHYGCPKCGSPQFAAMQERIEYCSERVYCTFTTTDPAEPASWDVDDYGDSDCYDSEAGEMDSVKECLDCSNEYDEPVFWPGAVALEEIAARSALGMDQIRPFESIFKTLDQAQTITVRQMPHATVIEAVPRQVERGASWMKKTWIVHACCMCGAEMESGDLVTRQMYRTVPGAPEAREKVIDSRLLPVLVRSALCAKCA